ncbi:MAG TPA: peptidoglycan-binding domain-containing protein [Roseiarcus sp.]
MAAPLQVDRLRLYLGAGLGIALVGIGVNALLFQHERRPAPLFGSLLAPFSSPGRPPAAPPAAKPASADRDVPASPSPAALPPARPTEAADASPSSPSDPITDLLRGEAHADGPHLVLAAQTALAKLGYPVKPDGNDGLATQQALRDFERTHGLPLSPEITPRLVKQLTVAARAGTH